MSKYQFCQSTKDMFHGVSMPKHVWYRYYLCATAGWSIAIEANFDAEEIKNLTRKMFANTEGMGMPRKSKTIHSMQAIIYKDKVVMEMLNENVQQRVSS